ncbi:GBS Bsp-like repeat-containing protein [Streptococcus parasuis]|uniref:GBS Bsp-like repeat-containing protein n=1 Tax=Streptococcus parasuis TaxID=1501662 RepID=UPI002898C34B|nr:GBS Bsp-like repeat-containing protein [Streptococcus parasuis]
MKKRTLFFLSVCAVALNGYVVHADSLEAPSQLVTVPNLPGIGGQLAVVEEAGQMKAVLSNITGEIVGVTGQFKSETNTGKTIAFTIDASGQYVAYLDRTSFSNEDQAFTLSLTANLIDGSAHNLDDYSFNWVKVAENTNDDSDLIENTNATEASKPVSSGTVVDSVEKDSSSSASETQSSSTASSSLAATVTDSSNTTSASTLTSTQTTSSVGSQLRSASLMRIATNSSAQSSAVTKASQIDQTLELKYTGSINSGEVIKFAVWSDEKGQDDIVWYNADQTGAAYADLRKHRDYGKYNIHTYVNRNGKMVYLNEIVVDVKASGTITISNVDSQTGSFDVTISNITAPRGLTKVYVPTWTEAGGQDDIKWYEANRQSDGSYKVSVDIKNHNYETGLYLVHSYGVLPNKQLVALAQTTHTVPKPQIKQTITQTSLASFDVVITGVPNYYTRVQVPTWTNLNNEDDIKWYEGVRQSDGSYKVSVDIKNHNYETGLYLVHSYGVLPNKQLVALAQTTHTVPKPQIKQTITQTSLASFDVVITGVPNYYTRVQVPTWTNLNNQDDIKWYEGVRQSDGSYKISVDIKNHNYETGLYLVHSYGVLPNKQLVPLAQTTYTVPQPQIKQTITQTSLASFDVVITGVPNYYTRVQVPTWTNLNNQDDIKWYEGVRQSDGSYKISVDIKNHNYETGLYLVHSYGVLPNKQLVPLAQTTYTVPQPQIKQTITQTSLASFDVVITGVPNYYTRVLIPTWTNYKDQDDIKWYEGVRQSDGSYKVSVDINNHNYETGLYHVHAYGVLPNKKLQAIFSATHTVSAFDIAKEQPSARSYTIYIDPGHGGVDSGASYGGVYEKNLALSVANKLKANLIQLGYQVLMTRTADYNVDFKTERSKMANQSNADLFISIHFNATGLASSNTTGIETYWYQYDPEYQPKINAAMHNDPTRLAESEILANQVHTSLISETGAVNRGVRRDTFAVLRETAIPAILVELGFMSNPSDLQKIKEDAYQTKLANALAQGIDNWYGAVGSKPTSGTSIQKKSTQQSQMTTSQQSFFNNILPAIQQVSQKNSIVTSVMLAQSILESGWGTSQLATNAYNIFGIKADSSWKGNTYTVQTKEVVNGKTITVEKQFRAYKSLLESISDYGSFFTSTAWRMKNYASFLQATNYETALTSLLASGYATDPAYAEKLKSLIQRYGLDQYDLN